MPYFSDKQIAKAREIDLLTYLQNTNREELVYDSKNTYHTRTHDSLKINNGMWYWFSRGIGGKSALDYLINVENFTFTDAVAYLLNEKGIEKRSSNNILVKNERITKLILPLKALNNNKVIDYLMSRGISKNVICYCINNNSIYQDLRNNVVFVGYDNENKAKYAGLRATNSSRFMYEAEGSDKNYSFKLTLNNNSNSIHLFESAIDLLSYATLIELKNEDWKKYNLLSLAGIYKTARDIKESKTPKTLSNFLLNNPNIKKIYLHFDNDNAGILASKAIQYSLSDSYEVINSPPKNGKDVNDFLCNYIKQLNKNNILNAR